MPHLYLVHHAEAADPGVDPQRPLTAGGRMHADQLAVRARDRGVKPAVIWHSGKLRAKQTAESFWRACNPMAALTAVRGLQPTDPPEWIRDALVGDARDILIVGHMPSLPRILGRLVGGSEGEIPEFPQHGMVALERDGERWIERWRI